MVETKSHFIKNFNRCRDWVITTALKHLSDDLTALHRPQGVLFTAYFLGVATFAALTIVLLRDCSTVYEAGTMALYEGKSDYECAPIVNTAMDYIFISTTEDNIELNVGISYTVKNMEGVRLIDLEDPDYPKGLIKVEEVSRIRPLPNTNETEFELEMELTCVDELHGRELTCNYSSYASLARQRGFIQLTIQTIDRTSSNLNINISSSSVSSSSVSSSSVSSSSVSSSSGSSSSRARGGSGGKAPFSHRGTTTSSTGTSTGTGTGLGLGLGLSSLDDDAASDAGLSYLESAPIAFYEVKISMQHPSGSSCSDELDGTCFKSVETFEEIMSPTILNRALNYPVSSSLMSCARTRCPGYMAALSGAVAWMGPAMAIIVALTVYVYGCFDREELRRIRRRWAENLFPDGPVPFLREQPTAFDDTNTNRDSRKENDKNGSKTSYSDKDNSTGGDSYTNTTKINTGTITSTNINARTYDNTNVTWRGERGSNKEEKEVEEVASGLEEGTASEQLNLELYRYIASIEKDQT